MAFGVMALSHSHRFSFATAFYILNIVQAVLGIIVTFWSIYIFIGIAPKMYSEKSEIRFVFAVMAIFGTHIIFHGLIGIKMCQKCYQRSFKKSTRSLLFIWIVAGCNTLSNILILAAMARRISNHIMLALKRSMERGLHNYLKDPFWKFTIDSLQVDMKCCGVSNYQDWYAIPWINEYQIHLKSDLVKQLRISKADLQLPVTPWSCCRVDYPLQCLHDPFQQIESAYLWSEQPTIIEESIYNNGCLEPMKRPIEIALSAFLIICIFLILIMISTIIISRLLYTSCRNAILLKDPTGEAPGWIFRKGAYGLNVTQIQEEIAKNAINQSSKSSKRSSKHSMKLARKMNFHFPRPKRLKKIFERSNKNSKSDEDPVSSGKEEALMLK